MAFTVAAICKVGEAAIRVVRVASFMRVLG